MCPVIVHAVGRELSAMTVVIPLFHSDAVEVPVPDRGANPVVANKLIVTVERCSYGEYSRCPRS